VVVPFFLQQAELSALSLLQLPEVVLPSFLQQDFLAAHCFSAGVAFLVVVSLLLLVLVAVATGLDTSMTALGFSAVAFPAALSWAFTNIERPVNNTKVKIIFFI